MDHSTSRLDLCSYVLHAKPSISGVTLESAQPPFEDSSSKEPNDIFAANTEEEISQNYNKILLTYGKWNAEMYLAILDEMSKKENKIQTLDISPVPAMCHMRCGTHGRDHKEESPQREMSSKYEKIRRDCSRVQEEQQSGVVGSRITCDQEGVNCLDEPSYKRIFKNAKLNKTTRREEKSMGQALAVPPEMPETTGDEEPTKKTDDESRKPCKLERNVPNNYLLEVRKKRMERDKKKVSFGSNSEVYMDDIERYYQNTPIQAVLENNLDEQIELIRASLKAHVTEVSGIDLLGRETGFNEMRARCLNNRVNIAEFQNMLNDSRWRRKFDLERIEDSDNANSLDVSDIPSSGSASVCSGDSLGSELDYRPNPVPPSRIPCMAEVRQMGDTLFDKISAKWEKVIKKNFRDAKLKPYFTHFCHAIRLRRNTAPVYSDILKVVEPYDDVYAKAFTPYKYKAEDKLTKIDDLQKAKDALTRKRRSFEYHQIAAGGWPPRRRHDLDKQGPTKYVGENQRRRLARIVRETKRRGEAESAWTKQAAVEDFVNLKPIIRTKNRFRGMDFINEPIVYSSSRPFASRNLHSLKNYETSLYDRRFSVTSPPCSDPPSKNKLAVSSKSILRMPI